MRLLIRRIIMLFMSFNFMAVGLGMMLFLATDSEFTCARTIDNKGECQYIEKGLIFKSVKKFQVKDLKETWIEKDCDSDEEKCSSSVRLLLKNGDSYNITSGESSYSAKEKVIYSSDINHFIKDPKSKTLKAEYKGAWFLSLIGGLFAFVGLALLLGSVFPFLKKIF